MSDIKEFFSIDNPSNKQIALPIETVVFLSNVSCTIGRNNLGTLGAPMPNSNDVYATNGSLHFVSGNPMIPFGQFHFVNNNSETALTISQSGAASQLTVHAIRFLRYPYAEQLKAGSVAGGVVSGGPDWLVPGSACRLNSVACDLEITAAASPIGESSDLVVESLHGLGFWTTSGGGVSLDPMPDILAVAPFVVDANGALVTRANVKLSGQPFFNPTSPTGGNAPFPVEGVKLPTIDYATRNDPAWQEGTLGWLSNNPNMPVGDSWLVVKTRAAAGPNLAEWQFVVLV